MKASEVKVPGFYWWLSEVGVPWRIVEAVPTYRDPSVLAFYAIGRDDEDAADQFPGVLIGPIAPPSAPRNTGCRARLAPGQHWAFCGETDMGQTLPALCTECGGEFKRA